MVPLLPVIEQNAWSTHLLKLDMSMGWGFYACASYLKASKYWDMAINIHPIASGKLYIEVISFNELVLKRSNV